MPCRIAWTLGSTGGPDATGGWVDWPGPATPLGLPVCSRSGRPAGDTSASSSTDSGERELRKATHTSPRTAKTVKIRSADRRPKVEDVIRIFEEATSTTVRFELREATRRMHGSTDAFSTTLSPLRIDLEHWIPSRWATRETTPGVSG